MGLSLLTLTVDGAQDVGRPADPGGGLQRRRGGLRRGPGRRSRTIFAVGDWTNFAGRYLIRPTGHRHPVHLRRGQRRLFPAPDGRASSWRSSTPAATARPTWPPSLSFRQTFAQDGAGAIDARLVYTAFLIDDEAGGGTADPSDALLVVIGEVRQGTRILASTRLEIGLSYQAQGTMRTDAMKTRDCQARRGGPRLGALPPPVGPVVLPELRRKHGTVRRGLQRRLRPGRRPTARSKYWYNDPSIAPTTS